MNKKSTVKNLINAILFICIIVVVITGCTYLFRNTEGAGRQNIIGIKSEPHDTLDVVYIGGSCVYRYWDTMKAYNDYGFTSYDYSVSGMAAATTISCIEDVYKTQNPQLIIFDIRKLLSGYESDEIGRDSRNVHDSVDLSWNRLKSIAYFCKLNNISFKDALAGYVDIMEYHDNYDALSDPLHWSLINNREKVLESNRYKGFVLYPRQNIYFEPDSSIFTDEKQQLGEVADRVLKDLLDYCRDKNINILFTSSPYVISEKNLREINYIESVAAEYGVPVVNANRHYSDMGLDFNTDFDDADHVNNYGSDKYTSFLGAYLTQNYNLPDHRNDDKYHAWNDLYDNEYTEQKESTLQMTDIIIDKKLGAYNNESDMRMLTDAYEWLRLAENDNYTLFISLDKAYDSTISDEALFFLDAFGITQGGLEFGAHISVYSGEVKYHSTGYETYAAGTDDETLTYEITTAENSSQIIINEEPYSFEQAGIHIIAYDNNTNTVFDKVFMDIEGDGNLNISHE